MSSYKCPLPSLTATEKVLVSKLSSHVLMLAGDIGARSLTSAPEGLIKAAGYIEYILRGYDYSSSREEFTVEVLSRERAKFTSEGINFPSVQHTTCNVIAELAGSKTPAEIVVVGAHYDSVYDCPAANDNGSGVAALLELAGLMKQSNPAKSIRFVAFTNEEPPFFRTDKMGSFVHAKGCKDRNEKIVAMLSLETIGFYSSEPNSQKYPHKVMGTCFPNTGNFLSFVANLQSARLLNRSLKAFRRSVDCPSEGVALPALVTGVDFSDQFNFWKYGYPALMVTDTAYLRYPHYHEAEDTPDKLDYEMLARVVTGLAGVLRELAGAS